MNGGYSYYRRISFTCIEGIPTGLSFNRSEILMDLCQIQVFFANLDINVHSSFMVENC